MVDTLHAMIELGALVVLLMLACPVVMGVMMLLMWRGMRHDGRRATIDAADRLPRNTSE